MTQFVRTAIDQHVATITIDRPDVHNAFNEVVIDELTRAFTAIGDDASIRAVILASAGPSFSAGADMHWMRRMVDYSMEENLADARAMAHMLRAIRDCPTPTIARVHGAAYGGGVGLTAACDIAVAVRSAVFALTEVRLGILPAVISPYVQEKIGPGAMRRYALTGERFDAEDARRLGLVSEVVDDADALDPRLDEIIRHLAKAGPTALAACKAVLRAIQPVDWDHATDVTTRHIARQRVSAEGQEGLRAFLEKRPPAWCEPASR